ncbi:MULTISPECIES: hypothetical protein [unclassified Candidatus Tisiphia]|uniref:hypothetical protein n=1 Tax=unclassified Candidatus Tisiphia TaxID=2996318 RepID=UPI00312C7EA5
MPAGLNIDNLKEAIRNGQQQNISLHNSQSIAAKLRQLLYSNDLENWNVKQGVSERSVQLVREYANAPKFYGTNSSKQKSIPQSQELAIGERILWQARSSGTLLTIEQIIQEATTEFSWQEKLTLPEAKYYMKYAETTGKDGSKHEFLGLQDGIYRDTLVAIAQNSKIKDKKSLELPELIYELQSEYEQKHRTSQVGAYHSFGDDEHYQSHIKGLESYGSDRIELYHVMVRDVSLLHQEQLTGIRGKIIKAHQKSIEQKIYEQIKTYQVKQARGQTSNKLDYDDKVKIAGKIYDNLCSSKLWQSLAVQDLTYVHKLQQEIQPEVQGIKKQEIDDLPQSMATKFAKTKNNSYEEKIEKIVEKYKGQNHNPELINKWTEELAELKTYSVGSLSNIIKIGEKKGLEQALKEIVSINADKNKELNVLFEVYKDRIDEIQKFNNKLTIENIKHTIKPLKYNDMVKAMEKMRVDSFRDWIIPQFNKIAKERQETQEVKRLLNSLEQEKELSLKIAKEYQSLTYNVSEEMNGESINDKSRVYDSQPDLLENIKRDSLYIAKYNIWEEELLIKELKRNTLELKNRVAPLMFKFSQLHCKKQAVQDIKVIEEQGILIKDKKQFKNVQDYLNDLMNNKEMKPYIRGTDLDGMNRNQEEHKDYIKSVFTKYHSKIETIVKLQPKYDIEQLKDKMKLENEKGVINLLRSEWLKSFKDYVTPKRAVMNQEREEAKSVSEVLQLLKKEKDFCLDMYKQYKEVVDYYSKKEQDHYFLTIVNSYKEQPELLGNLARDINNISIFKIGGVYTGDNIETDNKLVERIKDATQVGMLAKQLYKTCQTHVLKQINSEIKELNSHGTVKINDNTYDEIDYFEYRMNDKLLVPYLKNTTIDKRLTELYRQQQRLEQQKQL